LHDLVAHGLEGALGVPSVDGYQFDRQPKQLGSGAMGVVWEAIDLKLDRRVALKWLRNDCLASDAAQASFEKEAKRAANLQHNNIIRVYDFGVCNGRGYCAMELIDGCHLDEWVKRAKLSPRQVVELMAVICDAVGFAHAKGVIHLDLKPGNILVSRDGSPHVGDFGLSRSLSESEIGVRISGGTLPYMSPEQREGRGDLDGRSDVYSLGRILCQLLTKEMPPAFDTPWAPKNFGGIEAGLRAIIEKATAPLWRDRYRNADALGFDLKQYVDNASAPPRGNGAKLSEKPVASSPGAKDRGKRDVVGGAMPLESEMYIVRPTDGEFLSAIDRGDAIVLVKGARQMGKTSLLARGLQQARERGTRTAVTDFQTLNNDQLVSSETFYIALSELLARELELDVDPRDKWNKSSAANLNFEQFIKREVLQKSETHLVWGLDEVDRLFTCAFGGDVFALFRTWHNARALNPTGPWGRLTLAISYATEAHLFITDVNQSPFNVGTLLTLQDFTLEQMAHLNALHGSPLRSELEVMRLQKLVGGHPFLAQCSFREFRRGVTLEQLEATAAAEDGPFGDHLRRLRVMLGKDPKSMDAMVSVLRGKDGDGEANCLWRIIRAIKRRFKGVKDCLTLESFYRLRSAGVIRGTSTHDAEPRCNLYAVYLRKHLL
jgi:serine/threonine protein kinase